MSVRPLAVHADAPYLDRTLGLLQATATTIVAMVGIGPFLTIPYMIGTMGVPHSVAGGAVGFANYLQFAWSTMTPAQHHLMAAGVCLLMTALLHRDIESVGRPPTVMYSYGGYNQVCSIGEEIRSPTRTVPRAIVLAMLVVAVVYIVMSTVIVGMIPWQEVARTNTIAFPGPREGVLFSICYLAASVIAYLVFVRSSRSM